MPTPTEIETVLTLLAATPHRMAALTIGLDPTWLQAKPNADAWSVNEILAHLRACADVWGGSIVTMLAQDNPTLRYISPRTWIRKTNYPNQNYYSSLEAFTRQRVELLSVLQSLAHEGWTRPARFTGTVKGRDQTVFRYAKRIADHEIQHLEQLKIVLDGD